MKEQQVNIFWFRRDLRLNDNHGLFQALKNDKPVLAVFIFDTDILNKLSDKHDRRVNFIYDELRKLKSEIELSGSSLLIINDTPINAFQKICDDFAITDVFTNHDYEPYAIQRDTAVKSFLKTRNIGFHTFKDQVIFEKDEIIKSDGKPYTVYTPYSRLWKQKYFENLPVEFNSEQYQNNFIKIKPFHFPTIEEIGFTKNEIKISDLNLDKEIIVKYAMDRNHPSLNGTSYVGIHLRFGTLSIRRLAKFAQKHSDQWLNELIWREFFMMILFHFPYVQHQSFKKKYDNIKWRNNEKEFELWCKGNTGYPLVDAGMRQLNRTGWMHNRVRLVVASFLTKHLLIDWRWGEAFFAQKLIDYELASNNGNWQWAAGCGCDAAPYFRIFNPYEQTKKFDPEFIYIKRWIEDFTPDYLPPIVEHTFARQRALEVYKTSLEQ